LFFFNWLRVQKWEKIRCLHHKKNILCNRLQFGLELLFLRLK
jgi:hypothetical protein